MNIKHSTNSPLGGVVCFLYNMAASLSFLAEAVSFVTVF